VLIGEIGGDMEERAAAYIKKNVKNQYCLYCRSIGTSGKKNGTCWCNNHGKHGNVESKDAAFTAAGITVITQLAQSEKPFTIN
jgi:succinyl-CoA synthetase alpha subunit